MLALLVTALTAMAPQAPQAPSDPSTLGPAVGEKLPRFEARDQEGRLRDFESLKGANGLVLVFFRSADW